MYLKIDDYNGYSSFYFPLEDAAENGTWAEVLEHIEYALDDRFLALNGPKEHSPVGVKLSVEIVAELPEDAEMED